MTGSTQIRNEQSIDTSQTNVQKAKKMRPQSLSTCPAKR